MYCTKLQNIISHKDSPVYGVDRDTVNKLDIFIKKHTTMDERNNINPVRFSNLMHVDETASLMVFLIGTQCELFQVRSFYSCDCLDQYEIIDASIPVFCEECQDNKIPADNRDRIFLYFKLMEKPTECDNPNDQGNTPYDMFESYVLRKPKFSLTDADGVVGRDKMDTLLSQRNASFKKYLQGDTNVENG